MMVLGFQLNRGGTSHCLGLNGSTLVQLLSFLDKYIAYEHNKLVLEMFCTNCFNLVLGLQIECIVVKVDLLARVICPLEPISNGMLLQLYPEAMMSSFNDAYRSFFLL